MEITDIKTTMLCVPLKEPLRWGTGQLSMRWSSIIKITTDEGITGIGESLATPPLVNEIIKYHLKSILLGKDPFDIEVLWNNMYRSLGPLGLGLTMFVISGIDVALWDILGKVTKLPIHKLLGGCYRNRIEAYATGLYFKGTEALVNEAEGYVKYGFKAMKLKVGQGLEKDVEKVKAIREAVGNEIRLMVDATGAYDAHTAIKIGREFAKLNVYWFEEPVPREDIDGYVKVNRALDMPIASGECESTIYGFRNLITRRAVDIIQPEVAVVGGLTQCKKIADMADTYNIPCAPHFWSSAVTLTAALHFAASIPNFLIFEFDQTPNPLRDDLLMEPIKFKDGYLEVPNKPGLGIELNEKTIEKYCVKDPSLFEAPLKIRK